MDGIDARIRDFLSISSGYGYGSGYGSGYGDGDGYGYGSGSGDGSGYGYGSGDGYGYGYGYGSGSGEKDIQRFCGKTVYIIDGLPTLIDRIRGDAAKCRLLNRDLSTKPCFVVKIDSCFAHGDTMRTAIAACRDKLMQAMPEAQRIEAFCAEHKLGVPYSCGDLYDWHHRLTGSCEMGRRAFAKEHGIDIDAGVMTVEEFIQLTKDSYGGDTIRHLAEAYRIKVYREDKP